jgi:uncharacterized protein with GYD domain
MITSSSTDSRWALNVPLEGGNLMAIYVMLTTLTDEGRKTVKSRPERIREVNREIESMGAKVHA